MKHGCSSMKQDCHLSTRQLIIYVCLQFPQGASISQPLLFQLCFIARNFIEYCILYVLIYVISLFFKAKFWSHFAITRQNVSQSITIIQFSNLFLQVDRIQLESHRLSRILYQYNLCFPCFDSILPIWYNHTENIDVWKHFHSSDLFYQDSLTGIFKSNNFVIYI
jgi:hypothetical protein